MRSSGLAVRGLVLLLAAAGGGRAFAAKPILPVVTIPLQPLGFGVVPDAFALGTSTLYTLHFVDGTHVLLTWNAHSLMPRLPDATPNDDDRTVAATLMELPSGKVLAKTTWRTRDHAQFLYPLGNGRFLLRVRARLTELEPMRQLAAGEEAFKERPFLEMKRTIGFISVSAGGDLLTVETVPKKSDRSASAAVAVNESALDEDTEEGNRRAPVQVHFYRLHEATLAGGKVELRPISSGAIASPSLFIVPATAEGYLDVKRESSSTYDFDFKSHTGKRVELAAFDTSCAPRPYWVSRSEFVAFGCRGQASSVELGGFNLKGDFGWLQTFGDSLVSPSIVAAPEAGRFALERVVTMGGALIDPDNLTREMVTGQEIEVLQNHDGRVLLKVQASPVQRAGQNFDFSPDGTLLGVVRESKLEIYQLPALTLKDHSELAKATEAVPERNEATIELDSEPANRPAQAKAEGVKIGTEVMQKSAGEVVAPPVEEGKTSPEDGQVVGDVPVTRREAPTLYDAEHPKAPR